MAFAQLGTVDQQSRTDKNARAQTTAMTPTTALFHGAKGPGMHGTSQTLVRFCIVIIVQQPETPRGVDDNCGGGLAGHPLAAGARVPLDEVGNFSRPCITAQTQLGYDQTT